MRRFFRLDFFGYGGEFAAGSVDKAFVDYWLEVGDNQALYDHLQALDFGDDDSIDLDSPALEEGSEFYGMWEQDEYEHTCSLTPHSRYFVSEINNLKEMKEISEPEDYEIENVVYGREGMYLCGEDYEGNKQPVLLLYSIEKGNFFQCIVETGEEGFAPNLLCVTTLETEMDAFVERVFYGKQELELVYDSCSTTGKAMEAMVGYIIPEYREASVNEEIILECIEEIITESEA